MGKIERENVNTTKSATDSFFETYTPDVFGVLLGTGFNRFTMSSGIQGLAKVTGNSLEVLAVATTDPGKGKFRDFITAAKLKFDSIAVLDVWSHTLKACLPRYGFTRTETNDEINFTWRKENEAKHGSEATEGD